MQRESNNPNIHMWSFNYFFYINSSVAFFLEFRKTYKKIRRSYSKDYCKCGVTVWVLAIFRVMVIVKISVQVSKQKVQSILKEKVQLLSKEKVQPILKEKVQLFHNGTISWTLERNTGDMKGKTPQSTFYWCIYMNIWIIIFIKTHLLSRHVHDVYCEGIG